MVLCFLAPLVLAPAASALSATDLIGKWTGQLVITGRDRETKKTITMEFRKDGTVVVTPEAEEAERVPYAVEDGKLVFKKAKTKEPEVRLDNASLEGTQLKGVLVPVKKGKKTRWKIELLLRKQ